MFVVGRPHARVRELGRASRIRFLAFFFCACAHAVDLRQAAAGDFLDVAALDRIAWLHTGEAYIADGEHVWRVWCEYATVIVAASDERLADSGASPGRW